MMKNDMRPKNDAISAPRDRSAGRVFVARYESSYGGRVHDGMAADALTGTPRVLKVCHDAVNGGCVYDSMVVDALVGGCDLREYVWRKAEGHGLASRVRKLKYYWELWNTLRRAKGYDVVIRPYEAAPAPVPLGPRSVIMVHHLDFSTAGPETRVVSLATQFGKTLRRFAAIVVVATFWEDYLRRRGYTNVHKIYNGFDVAQFTFAPGEVEAFTREHQLTGKPTVYLGNFAGGKGVDRAFAALEDLDAHFVVSGKTPHPNPRIRSFYLEYRDYLRLLRSCTVVLTLSQFLEGWCRVAHEAMLCKTPVIGSGAGGMRELLAGGGQAVLTHLPAIRREVQTLLADPDRRREIGERGYAFASAFTVERTHRAWQDLVRSLLIR